MFEHRTNIRLDIEQVTIWTLYVCLFGHRTGVCLDIEQVSRWTLNVRPFEHRTVLPSQGGVR